MAMLQATPNKWFKRTSFLFLFETPNDFSTFSCVDVMCAKDIHISKKDSHVE